MIKTFSHKDKLPGGLADHKKPEDFDADELAKGIKVEQEEHTSDEDIAGEIAMDHMTEDEEYYDKLAIMEKGSVLNEIESLLVIANEFDSMGFHKFAADIDGVVDLLLKEPKKKV